MSFQEDLSAFFGDFGVLATSGGKSAQVLFYRPDEAVVSGFGIATNYAIEYVTTSLPLAHGATVIVDGVTYNVNEVRAVDDGVISRAMLQA